MCDEAAAMLVAARCSGGRESAGINRARALIRPIPISDLLGDLEYAEFWRSDAAKMELNVMPGGNQSDRDWRHPKIERGGPKGPPRD